MLHKFKIDLQNAGQRLDRVVAELCSELSRSRVQSLIADKRVRVNQVVAKKSGLLVESGDLIEVEIPEVKTLDLTPQKVDIKILHEDESIAVLYKSPGISVHPSSTENKPTVVHGLLFDLKKLSSVGGTERPGIVHRLDKGTSGVMVVSKTDEAHQHLSEQFKNHTAKRTYVCIVFGTISKKLPNKQGRIESFFGRNTKDRKKFTGKLTSGRKAITNWKLLYEANGLSVVECILETGRTHQIRVHLSELGYPIVGDGVYGDSQKLTKNLKTTPALVQKLLLIDHQLLHAYRLELDHPETEKRISFEYEPPNDFKEVLGEMKCPKSILNY